jgi:hypothetical protein
MRGRGANCPVRARRGQGALAARGAVPYPLAPRMPGDSASTASPRQPPSRRAAFRAVAARGACLPAPSLRAAWAEARRRERR